MKYSLRLLFCGEELFMLKEESFYCAKLITTLFFTFHHLENTK